MKEKRLGQEFILKIKDETRNRSKLVGEYEAQEGLCNSELASECSFCSYWMCFNFCFSFLALYSYRN